MTNIMPVNNSFEKINDHIGYLKSFNHLEQSKRVNVIANFLVVIFGLLGKVKSFLQLTLWFKFKSDCQLGNLITIALFAQKRLRTNAGLVFLLCLAINDSLFLIIHLFEVENLFI